MSTLRKSLRICRLEFAALKRDVRFYLVLFLLLSLVLSYTNGLFSFSARIKTPVTPWLLPLQMVGNVNRMIVYGCAALFFSNLFRNRNADRSVLIRSGWRAVLLGKLLYVLLAAFLYCILYVAATLLPHIGRLYFSSEWGDVLQQWSEDGSLSVGMQIPGSLYVLQSGSGPSLTLWSLLHLWLALVTIGLLMFWFNSGGGFLRGGVAAGVLLGLDRMTGALLLPGLGWLPWVSPLSWSNPMQVDFGRVPLEAGIVGVPAWYADAAAVLLNLLLIALIVAFAHASYRNGSRREWICLS